MRPSRAAFRLVALSAAIATSSALMPAASSSAAVPLERAGHVEQEVEQECFEPGADIATSARGG